MASWQRITAPILLLMADQGFIHQRFESDQEELQRRLQCFKDRQIITVANSGHNVQHDQPEQVANALDQFLTAMPA